MGPHIRDRVAQGPEPSDERTLEAEPPVVCSDRDPHPASPLSHRLTQPAPAHSAPAG